jgi:hypothetical protein
MSKKRRASSGDLFQCPIQHVSANDVRDFFTIKENIRFCTLCKSSFKFGINDKTTSTLRTHLKTKHTQEVLAKHPKPTSGAEPNTKMSKLFDPFVVRATQDKYDKACLLRFIANAESYSSLGNQGIYLMCCYFHC